MELKCFKSLWGMEEKLEQCVEKIASAGYQGIETPLFLVEDHQLFQKLLEEYNLECIIQIFTDPVDHIGTFQEELNRAETFGPILVNSQSAKDSMSWDEQLHFFDGAIAIENRVGVSIAHETHRGRAMYTPWHTAQLLTQFPELQITADISHWLCVCESLLEDQEEALRIAYERTIHIHARVGYAEGPQVPHPGAPEYADELLVHQAFWQKVYQNHRLLGKQQMLYTPEFGPPNYMHTHPFTNEPVSDLWEVCLWMKTWFEQNIPCHE